MKGERTFLTLTDNLAHCEPHYLLMCVCVCACVRACMRACMRACVRHCQKGILVNSILKVECANFQCEEC